MAILAKLCYDSKQHFARLAFDTGWMAESINQVFAENLDHYMKKHALTQAALAKASSVAQRSISNYLRPKDRHSGKTGKEPSAKLTELEMVAAALGVPSWKLLRPFSAEERDAYDRVEAAFLALTKAAPPPPVVPQLPDQKQASANDGPLKRQKANGT